MEVDAFSPRTRFASARLCVPGCGRANSFSLTVLVLLELLASVAGFRVVGVSTSTSSTGDTMISIPEDGIRYFEFSGTGAFNAFAVGSKSINSNSFLKVFKRDGTLVVSAVLPADSSGLSTVVMRDPLEVYIACRTSFTAKYTISYNAGTHAIIRALTLNHNNANYDFLDGAQEPDTTYLYLNALAGERLLKINSATLAAVSVASSAIADFFFTNDLHLWQSGGTKYVLYAAMGYNRIIILDRTVLTTTIRSYSQSYPLLTSLVDNLNSNTLYINSDGTTPYLLEYNLAGLPGTLSYNRRLQIASIYDYAINLGSHLYIAMLQSNGQMLIVRKTDLTRHSQVLTISLFSPSTMAPFSFFGTEIVGADRAYFGFVMSTGSYGNFQSYYLLFDNCTARGASDLCTSCQPGYNHDLDTATQECFLVPAPMTPGRGVVLGQNKFRNCLHSDCIECQNDYTVCSKCDLQQRFYLSDTTCLSADLLPTGKGLSLQTGLVVNCQQETCQDCKKDSSVCNDHSPPKTGSDNLPTTYLNLENKLNLLKTESTDFSFSIATESILDDSTFYREVASRLRLEFVMTQTEGLLKENVSYDLNLVPISSAVRCNIRLTEIPEKKSYSVQLLSNESFQFEHSGKYYIIYVNSSVENAFSNEVDKQKVEAAEETGQTLSTAIGGGLTGPAASAGIIGLLMLDPSGLLMRFSQLLKIATKLYYVNINYGRRLDAFLSKIRHFMAPNKETNDKEFLLHSKYYRGKLSRDLLALDFYRNYLTKGLIYFASWVLKVTHWIFGLTTWRVWKPYLYLIYYSQKVHCLVFGVFFIDFALYSTRSILHSRDIGIGRVLFAYCALVFVLIDFIEILKGIYDDEAWDLELKRQGGVYSKATQIAAQGKLHSKMGQKGSTSPNSQLEKRKKEIMSKTQPLALQINYPKTYSRINSYYHLINQASTFLRLDSKVYMSKLCRCSYPILVVRMSLYQLVVVGCQYSSGLGLSSLLLLEFSKIFGQTITHFRYKHLKNLLVLLMEISQSLFLSVFLLMDSNPLMCC